MNQDLNNKLKILFALTLVAFLPFGLMIWFRSHSSSGFASLELITYPLLFGGLSIVAVYLLQRFYLRSPLKELNPGKGKWGSDILWGLILVTIYFLLFYVERATLTNLLEFRSNSELLGLMLSMRENPILLVLWFGPVLWIGIALYEELIRVFLLVSLWKFSSKPWWAFVVMLFVSLLIGFAHWSQGSYGIVTIAIKSMVACFFFLKVKRLLPLIIAHALYDGIQVALLLITYPQS